jgi:hypothetical protein
LPINLSITREIQNIVNIANPKEKNTNILVPIFFSSIIYPRKGQKRTIPNPIKEMVTANIKIMFLLFFIT